jgi:hypothetical protein
MRTIKLRDYTVKLKDQEGNDVIVPYIVKNSILTLLTARELKLNGPDLLKNNALALKINDMGDEALLEEEEYARLKRSVEMLQGFGQEDVEFIRRIMEAPEVAVKPIKPEGELL